MSNLWKILSFAAALTLGPALSTAWAQDTTTPTPAEDAPAEEEPASPDLGLSMGQEVQTGPQTGDGGIGTSYVAAEFGDWQQRCIRTEDGSDPCQLYQLLKDAQGNAVSEMSLFPLPEGQQAAAGSTIITPLETLLTSQLTISIDGAQPKRYPFEFCAAQGCFSRIGFTEAEVLGFKRGNQGLLTIVPAAAPDRRIELTISLSGFTAGFDAVAAANAE